MTVNEKRQVITLTIGAVAAIAAAAVGLIASDVPKNLREIVGSPTAWSIALTCTIPLIIVLAANQISSLLKASADREEVVREIARVLPQASLITHFESSAEAMQYLIKNVPLAKCFYNTRLASMLIEQSDPANLRVTQELDTTIARAIRKGMDYHWVISPEYEQNAMTLRTEWRQYAGSKKAGIYSYWVLPESNVHLFHFAILEYAQTRELLLGWALSSARSFSEKVFLIRDDRVVQYFRGAFEIYVARAREA
jgi:hypothetical protein